MNRRKFLEGTRNVLGLILGLAVVEKIEFQNEDDIIINPPDPDHYIGINNGPSKILIDWRVEPGPESTFQME